MTALPEPVDDDLVIAEPRRRSWIRRGVTAGWLLPGAALLIGLFIVPTAYAVYLGFTNLELLGQYAQQYNFTGLANVQRMIHDPTFWLSVKLTLIFVLGSGVIAQTVLGLALALLGQRVNVVVRSSVGAIVILAWVLPEITVAFVWYSFSQAGGTLSHLFGTPNSDLLSTVPMLVVCMANAWRGTAFSMLLLSAGLRNVPAEVNEAAELEGAGYWRRLFTVTLPIMRPTLMINLLLITLATISDFTLIFAMTQGGPGVSTQMPAVYVIQHITDRVNVGQGMAAATMMLLPVIVLILLQNFLQWRAERKLARIAK